MSVYICYCWVLIHIPCGALAQLIERSIRIAEVAGLIPARSTILKWALFLKEKVPTPKERGLKSSQAKPDSIFAKNDNMWYNNTNVQVILLASFLTAIV